jgi:hypothetical protein
MLMADDTVQARRLTGIAAADTGAARVRVRDAPGAGNTFFRDGLSQASRPAPMIIKTSAAARR